MNIFKTLASGSGSINEPNVSAFLGYLLNPKEDHGLGDTFLRKFLQPLNLDFMKGKNLSIRSKFEIEVLLEQAFEIDSDSNGDTDDSQQIVDIVILCYEKNSSDGRFLVQEIIEQRQKGMGNPKHIFLIENKIKDASFTKGQLEKQYLQTIAKLGVMGIDNAKDLVSVIYVTPESQTFKDEFNDFNKTTNKIPLFWRTKKDNSISKMIKEILEKETQPIDVYCKHTLQAFWEFIENGFKSTITEELELKNKDYTKYDFDGATNLPKNRLVRAVIAKYVQDNQGITLKDLQDVFPKKLQGLKDCVIDADEAKMPSNNGYYFNELITLENGHKIAISNWWDKYNLLKFITKAESLGYKISKSTLI